MVCIVPNKRYLRLLGMLSRISFPNSLFSGLTMTAFSTVSRWSRTTDSHTAEPAVLLTYLLPHRQVFWVVITTTEGTEKASTDWQLWMFSLSLCFNTPKQNLWETTAFFLFTSDMGRNEKSILDLHTNHSSLKNTTNHNKNLVNFLSFRVFHSLCIWILYLLRSLHSGYLLSL